VPPGTERLLATATEERSPRWYDSAPPPDPPAVEAMLEALPVNAWVQAIDGGRKRPTYAYGTIAFDPDRDEILVWGGGHSTTHGTEITRYSLTTGRWHIDYPPQLAMGYNRTLWGANYAYGYRPWMPRHPWMAYTYDPVAGRLVLLRTTGPLTLTFDPDVGDFERPEIPLPPGGGSQPNRVCATPRGAVVWTANGGLHRLDWPGKRWVRLPAEGPALPKAGFSDGIVYDARRKRLLLLFANPRGQVWSYDLAGGAVRDLKPAHPELAPGYLREFEYVPTADLAFDMMGCAYDAASDEWVRLKIDTEVLTRRSRGKERQTAGNTDGLAYDPKRDLLWAVNGYQNKGVYVLKLDAAKAR
jgi:hypothetical protein